MFYIYINIYLSICALYIKKLLPILQEPIFTPVRIYNKEIQLGFPIRLSN